MVNDQIIIGHLYAKQMNVYGDMGNVITLRYRLEQRGYRVKYVVIDSLAQLKHEKLDILIGGGGQDSNQGLIQGDLQKNAALLKGLCEDGLVTLMICGMYQLFGHRFILADGSEIKGVGILDLETRAGDTRLIGNIVTQSSFGKLVGFENHSGRTYLGPNLDPLGKVLKGAGNNGEDEHEGAVYKNTFGTYMHGPLLAKNPQLADELLARALKNKGVEEPLAPLDDFIEHQAARIAMKRPR
jgi:hypothetical protein